MKKKHKPSEVEIMNDPSLKYSPYTKWCIVFSDSHGEQLRFCRYTEDGKIVLATVNGITELPDPVDPLTVRRIVPKPQVLETAEKLAMQAHQTLTRLENRKRL